VCPTIHEFDQCEVEDTTAQGCGYDFRLWPKSKEKFKAVGVATAKAITLRIPRLKDCKNHFDAKKEKGKDTMVFICEGQSAADSITS